MAPLQIFHFDVETSMSLQPNYVIFMFLVCLLTIATTVAMCCGGGKSKPKTGPPKIPSDSKPEENKPVEESPPTLIVAAAPIEQDPIDQPIEVQNQPQPDQNQNQNSLTGVNKSCSLHLQTVRTTDSQKAESMKIYESGKQIVP